MVHSYPEKTETQLFKLEHSGSQLFRASKIVGHSYLDPENTGSQLVRAIKYCVAAIYTPKILSHRYVELKIVGDSYLYTKKTWSQLFGAIKS